MKKKAINTEILNYYISSTTNKLENAEEINDCIKTIPKNQLSEDLTKLITRKEIRKSCQQTTQGVGEGYAMPKWFH